MQTDNASHAMPVADGEPVNTEYPTYAELAALDPDPWREVNDLLASVRAVDEPPDLFPSASWQ